MCRGRGMRRGRGKARDMSRGKFLTNERGISRGNWDCFA